jgi:predicted RNA-binding protein with PUA-like domain
MKSTSKTDANYWLLKTEPDSFSIEDMRDSPGKTTCWDGVRNYQARNTLRDQMQLGDRVLIYHSSTDPTAIVGIARIVKAGYPDHTAWDKKSPHYDPDSTKDNPRWFMVDIQLERIFQRPVTLAELKKIPALKQMELLRKGSRLSVQPVRKEEFKAILKLAEEP